MKRILHVSIIALLLLCLSVGGGFAAEDSIKVNLDGKAIPLDTGVLLQNGRTFVPFRGIFEAMGMEVG